MNNKEQNELLKPSPGQIIYRNRKWAENLEQNPRRAFGQMVGNGGGKCCLMVAEDTARELGLNVEVSNSNDLLPAFQISSFFGWPDDLILSTTSIKRQAFNLNDSLRIPHKIIAECVRNTFCRKHERWTNEAKKVFAEKE